MNGEYYHYKECGLNYVFLANGFNFYDTPGGKIVSIDNIESLHKVIGRFIIDNIKDLDGQEIKFIRNELLMSPARLAHNLQTSEQTLKRWESNHTPINGSAETILRMLYLDYIGENPKIRQIIKRMADIENEIDISRKKLLNLESNKNDIHKNWKLLDAA